MPPTSSADPPDNDPYAFRVDPAPAPAPVSARRKRRIVLAAPPAPAKKRRGPPPPPPRAPHAIPAKVREPPPAEPQLARPSSAPADRPPAAKIPSRSVPPPQDAPAAVDDAGTRPAAKPELQGRKPVASPSRPPPPPTPAAPSPLPEAAASPPPLAVAVEPAPALRANTVRPALSERRRVRFDPSLLPPPVPGAAQPATAGFLHAVYTARRRSRPPPQQRTPAPQQRRLSAAAPIDVAAAVRGAETPGERALVDQLQYLLDGVVNASRRRGGGGAAGAPPAPDDPDASDLLFETLAELAALFLQMAPPPPNQRAEAAAAAGRPSMLLRLGGTGVLETVVARLLSLRARSTPIALLVGTVMLVLARSDATDALFDSPQVAALVDAFFHVLPALAVAGTHAPPAPAQTSAAAAPDAVDDDDSASHQKRRRRRGKLARRASARTADDDSAGAGGVMARVCSLLVDGCGVEPAVAAGVQQDARGVAIVFGLALAAVLEVSQSAREAMAERRRVHKIVAILVETERRCRAPGPRAACGRAAAAPVVAVALRVLEFATLHRGCLERVARESLVVEAAVSVLRLGDAPGGNCAEPGADDSAATTAAAGLAAEAGRGSGDKGAPRPTGACAFSSPQPPPPPAPPPPPLSMSPRHDEAALADALKLCVNLTHKCRTGLAQFVACGGVGAVLDLIASPTVWPRCGAPPPATPLRETFDVRVLSVALLSSVVAQDRRVCASFQDLRPCGVVEREGGAVAFVLELLKVSGGGGGKAGGVASVVDDVVEVGDADAGSGEGVHQDRNRRIKEGGKDDGGSADGSSAGIEQRVMTGYLCLLVGALAAGSAHNRALVLSAMPGKTLAPVADVLDEFLVFHHELGVVSSSVDDMYAVIIESLREGGDVDAGVPVVNLSGAGPGEAEGDVGWLTADVRLEE